MQKNIRISLGFNDVPFVRQTPGNSGIWNDCHFFFEDTLPEYDYWVVYNSPLASEITKCPPQNSLLVTGEPSEILTYPAKFTNRFGHVITNIPQIHGKDVIQSQTGLPWRLGKKVSFEINPRGYLNYDDFVTLDVPVKKKSISVITSNKTMIEGHRKRLDFVLKLQEYFGSEIDIYGRGINEIEDKWEAIVDYKYHISIENSSIPNYWTEKIGDSYLGWSFPVYFGCPNINQYFPIGSYQTIDINDFSGSVKTIERILNSHVYENSLESLQVARQLILNKYNFFPLVDEFIQRNYSISKSKWIVIMPLRKKVKHKARLIDFVHLIIICVRKLTNKTRNGFNVRRRSI